MFLAIDIGNTNTVFALFKEGSIVHQWRIRTHKQYTADEYALSFTQLLALHQITLEDITKVLVSSVVPQTNEALAACFAQHSPAKLRFVHHLVNELDITIKTDRPEEVGTDRIVNAIACHHLYHSSAIVVDFGTATTFDVIDNQGDYCGGVIAPGIQLSLKTLQQAAAQLPSIALEKPESAIGKNTVTAMQSGIYLGYQSMIQGMIEAIRKEQPATHVVATGGLAELFYKDSDYFTHLEPDLTLIGLQIVEKVTA